MDGGDDLKHSCLQGACCFAFAVCIGVLKGVGRDVWVGLMLHSHKQVMKGHGLPPTLWYKQPAISAKGSMRLLFALDCISCLLLFVRIV